MTGDIKEIRNKIGGMLWDANMHPLHTFTGFKVIVDNTKVLVTIEKIE